MPRSGQGVLSQPAGTRAVANTVIESGKFNAIIDDLIADANAPRPVGAGGTGVTNLADLASALAPQLINAILPAGLRVGYCGSTAPDGWLLCYGQAVSRTQYARLFVAIGTGYGQGNGSTTFNLPDYRGRVGAGKDDMGGSPAGRLPSKGSAANTLGGNFGVDRHTLQLGEMPNHSHGVNDPGHAHGYSDFVVVNGNGYAGGNQYGASVEGRATAGAGTGISIQANGGNQAHDNVQPTNIENVIIKV